MQISSASHPFFTGEEKIIDTEGRVDRFKARAKKAAALKSQLGNKAAKAKKEAAKKAEEDAKKEAEKKADEVKKAEEAKKAAEAEAQKAEEAKKAAEELEAKKAAELAAKKAEEDAAKAAAAAAAAKKAEEAKAAKDAKRAEKKEKINALKAQCPPQYKPVGTSAYFWVGILCWLPVIGIFITFILSIAPKNRNLKCFARSKLAYYLIIFIACLIIVLVAGAVIPEENKIAISNACLKIMNALGIYF
jgi:uncharacterized membrane protein